MSGGDDNCNVDKLKKDNKRHKTGVGAGSVTDGHDDEFTQQEQQIIQKYYEYKYRDRKKNRHKFENTTATFIGDGGVGKTLLVRALWKGRIERKTNINVDAAVNDDMDDTVWQLQHAKIENSQRMSMSIASQRDNHNDAYGGEVTHSIDTSDSANGAITEDREGIHIEFDKINVRPANLGTVLQDYNHYNLIDYYCRWDTVLRRSFRFYDTVGDLRFFRNSLSCIRKSDIIVAVYNLNQNLDDQGKSKIDKSIKFLQSFDQELFKIFSRDINIGSQ